VKVNGVQLCFGQKKTIQNIFYVPPLLKGEYMMTEIYFLRELFL